MNFYQILKSRRLELGYTLDHLAEISGLSKSFLSTLENGISKNPSINTLAKLSDALAINFQSLITEKNVDKDDELILKFNQLSFRDRKRIKQIIDIFLKDK